MFYISLRCESVTAMRETLIKYHILVGVKLMYFNKRHFVKNFH